MTIRPYADRGLLVDLPSRAARRALLAAWGGRADLELVAGERAVLELVAQASDRPAVVDELAALELRVTPDADGTHRHTIPVRYDGPDLDAVARAWGCRSDEVAQRHCAIEWSVEFLGFTPGFAYLVTDAQLPTVPRRETPRARVPAGSVALAGDYCGVYPQVTPGGWQLIGSTDATIFDPSAARPALLAPGDTVRFGIA